MQSICKPLSVPIILLPDIFIPLSQARPHYSISNLSSWFCTNLSSIYCQLPIFVLISSSPASFCSSMIIICLNLILVLTPIIVNMLPPYPVSKLAIIIWHLPHSVPISSLYCSGVFIATHPYTLQKKPCRNFSDSDVDNGFRHGFFAVYCTAQHQYLSTRFPCILHLIIILLFPAHSHSSLAESWLV